MPLTVTETSGKHFSPYAQSTSFWSGFIALGTTIIVHILIILVLPDQFMPIRVGSKEVSNKEDIYEISLITPDQMRFVEANPAAPKNEPDSQKQYSFRSQQAADESPKEDKANVPQVDGDTNSQKILEGDLEQIPPVKSGVYSPTLEAEQDEGDVGGEAGKSIELEQLIFKKPLPAPNFIKQKPITKDGLGSDIKLNSTALELLEKSVPDAHIDVYRPQPNLDKMQPTRTNQVGGTNPSKLRPRARPRLDSELLTGPLMNSKSSARRRGALAIDATFSEFGEYQQQFFAAIQTGWYQEIDFFQPIDTAASVNVRLTMHADGKVNEVEVMHTTASEIASLICKNAITKRSPFRRWTPEMIKVFGSKRKLNVKFHYK